MQFFSKMFGIAAKYSPNRAGPQMSKYVQSATALISSSFGSVYIFDESFCLSVYQVSLVDYGPTVTVTLSDVRALTNELAAHPLQAFAAYLTNIEPISDSCTKAFAKMVCKEFLYAKIVEWKVKQSGYATKR